jgi:hypothetical protein
MIALSSSLSVPDSFKAVGTIDPSTLKKVVFWAHGTADYVPLNCESHELDRSYVTLLTISRSQGLLNLLTISLTVSGSRRLARVRLQLLGLSR